MDPAGAPSLGLPELRAALSSPDPMVRALAISRVRAEPGVQEVLIDAVEDASAEVRRAAVRALGRLHGATAIRTLIRVSTDDTAITVRAEAVAAIGRILEVRTAARGADEPSAPDDPGSADPE